MVPTTLQWRHMNATASLPNHRQLDYSNSLVDLTTKKIARLCITGALWRDPPVTYGSPTKGQQCTKCFNVMTAPAKDTTAIMCLDDKSSYYTQCLDNLDY